MLMFMLVILCASESRVIWTCSRPPIFWSFVFPLFMTWIQIIIFFKFLWIWRSLWGLSTFWKLSENCFAGLLDVVSWGVIKISQLIKKEEYMSVHEKQNVKEFQLLDKPINHSINKRYTKTNNLHTKKWNTQ